MSRPAFLLLACATWLAALGPAQAPVRVADFGNPSSDVPSSPGDWVRAGSQWFFRGDDGLHGHELFVTDGTKKGTRLVLDIEPGPTSSWPAIVAALGQRVFFAATTRREGRELWVSDGTKAGTRLVADIHRGPGHGLQRFEAAREGAPLVAPGRLVFKATDAQNDERLWSTDGTAAGTFVIQVAAIGGLTALDDRTAVFHGYTWPEGYRLWKTDGTAKGTVRLHDGFRPKRDRRAFKKIGRVVYVEEYNPGPYWSVWRTDGTRAGTQHAKELPRGASRPFLEHGGYHYFPVVGTANIGLWRTDGKKATRITGLHPPRDDSIAVYKNRVYFSGLNLAHGRELWSTDGTTAGTRRESDISPGPGSSHPTSLTVFRGKLYFGAVDGQGDGELYATEGTPRSPERVKDLNPRASSGPSGLRVVGSKLVFSAIGDGIGREYFESDGTAKGTKLLFDLTRGDDGRVQDLCDHFGQLYFSARLGARDAALWTSDGSTKGTSVFAHRGTGLSHPAGMTSFNGEMYFSAWTNRSHPELVRTDSASSRGWLKIDRYYAKQWAEPTDFTVVRDKLFFVASQVRGRELYVSDGTYAGTRNVVDLEPGYSGSDPIELTAYRDKLYFRPHLNVKGDGELWASDGTALGTKLVVDLWPGTPASMPRMLTVFRDRLYFVADSPTSRAAELFVTDGTAKGTQSLRHLHKGLAFTRESSMVASEDALLFVARDAKHGLELFATDGKSTRLVRDLEPGSAGSAPRKLASFGKWTYFSATTTKHGEEPYATDGTSAGTKLIADLKPGAESSEPTEAVVSRGAFYFGADDAKHRGALFAWRPPLASVRTIGESCGPTHPKLRATTPVLGSTLAFDGTAQKPDPGILFLNTPQRPAPVAGCLDYIRPVTAFALAVVGGPTYRVAVALPNDARLLGATFHAQAWFFKVPTILPIQTTNAVVFTVGR